MVPNIQFPIHLNGHIALDILILLCRMFNNLSLTLILTNGLLIAVISARRKAGPLEISGLPGYERLTVEEKEVGGLLASLFHTFYKYLLSIPEISEYVGKSCRGVATPYYMKITGFILALIL